MGTADLIAAIDEQLAILIATPEKIIDFKEGNVDIKANQMIESLRKLRADLVNDQDAEVSYMEFDTIVNQFG